MCHRLVFNVQGIVLCNVGTTTFLFYFTIIQYNNIYIYIYIYIYISCNAYMQEWLKGRGNREIARYQYFEGPMNYLKKINFIFI